MWYAWIKIEGIAWIQNERALSDNDLNCAFKDQIELLAAMGHQRWLAFLVSMRLQLDQHRLHGAVLEIERKGPKRVTFIAFDFNALPRTD